MPNCFQLFKKGSKQPEVLQVVDSAICEHFNTPCDTVNWHHGWYDYIGFMLAMGKDWQWLKDDLRDNPWDEKGSAHMRDIVDFLESNYTTSAWYETRCAA